MKGARRDTDLAGLKVPAMSADDLNPPDISEIVLGTLQRLLQAFPERTSVAKVFGDKMASSDLVRVWSWMLQQQLVSGEVDDGCLTLTGHKSVCEAIKTHPELAPLLADSRAPVRRNDTDRLILAVLRAHFVAYLDRTPKCN